MNARRAANRARSRDLAEGHDQKMDARNGERHEDMRGRHVHGREPLHHEENYRPTHTPHASHASPASQGTSKGPGPLPGAGELVGRGPGVAAGRYAPRDSDETDNSATPSGDTPRGMKTYAQE